MTRKGWIQLALVVALGLSVIANFFLLGVVVGGAREAPGARFLMNRIASDYPQEVRTKFRHVLRQNRPETMAALQRLREAHERLAAAANASPLDEKAVDGAMQGVREATSSLQELLQGYLLTALKNVRAERG